MKNLMKSLAVMAAVLFTTSNVANAQNYWPLENTEPSSIGSISVFLGDDAENACWTNLREAREYAEEKLKIAGYNVSSEVGEYTFAISVIAQRLSNGNCYGAYTIQVYATNLRKDVWGFHEIGTAGGIAYQPSNFNTLVIEIISGMIAEM